MDSNVLQALYPGLLLFVARCQGSNEKNNRGACFGNLDLDVPLLNTRSRSIVDRVLASRSWGQSSNPTETHGYPAGHASPVIQVYGRQTLYAGHLHSTRGGA